MTCAGVARHETPALQVSCVASPVQPLSPSMIEAGKRACGAIKQLSALSDGAPLTADAEVLMLASIRVVEMVAMARKAAAPQQQCPPPSQVLRCLLDVDPTLPVHVHQTLLIPVVQHPYGIRVLSNIGVLAPLMSGVCSCRLRGWWSMLAPTGPLTYTRSCAEGPQEVERV